jgi:hypothetical protein
MDIILPQRAQIQESVNVGRLEGKLCQACSLSTIRDLPLIFILKLTSFFLYFIRLDSRWCETIRLQVLPDGHRKRSVIVSTGNSGLASVTEGWLKDLPWVRHMCHRMTVLRSLVTVGQSAAHCGVGAVGDRRNGRGRSHGS